MKRLIVIGGGPGGYEAAIRFAQRGGEATLIEKADVGGTCLNRGCIPTKALLHAADSLAVAKGVGACVLPDAEKIFAQKDAVVTRLRGGVEALLNAHRVMLVRGQAQILDAQHVRVGQNTLEADDLLIATGARPVVPGFPGHDLPGVMTSDELLAAALIPSSLLILGGGVIGVEMATAFSGLGSRVTIVEAMERLLPQADRELSQSVMMNLRKAGVTTYTGARLERIEQGDNGLLSCALSGQSEPLCAQNVLICVGRAPNTDGLFAEGFCVQTERGRIITDDRFETSVAHVYAVGDVTSRVQLAHLASAQGRNVADRLMDTQNAETDLSVIPSCVYTRPEIAFVGLSESDARTAGRAVKTAKYLMSSNGRTLIAGGERGFFKIVTDAENGCILGAQILGERATDMIDEFSVAIANHLTADDLLRAMRPHPTFIEGAQEALEALLGLSIHTPPARR